MTFFPEPLKPSEGKKEEDIKVHPIEGDKKGKEEQMIDESSISPRKKELISSAFLFLMKKLTSFFTRERREALERLSSDDTMQDITAFNLLLKQLKNTDLSQTIPFCKQLSKYWNLLLQHQKIAHRLRKKSWLNSANLDLLIQEINNFPEEEDQKLGYYLSEYAGEDWLPIPFMDILRKLYDDHQVNREASILEKWTTYIRAIPPDISC